MYRDQDLNESIGERTVRQADRQKLWLCLAAFWCQTTKKIYKIIKKNGQLLKWLKLKKVKFLKTWAHFLGAHTDTTSGYDADLFKNHRQTFLWPGERPSSHVKVTKMWLGPCGFFLIK